MPRFDVTIAGELNLDLILYGLPDDLAEVVAATLARDQQTRPSATDLAAICRAHRPRPARQMLAQPSPPTPRRHALAAQAGG